MMLGDEKMREWDSVFNPFNSLKVLAWRESFEEIMANRIPLPVSVTVDSTNLCNLFNLAFFSVLHAIQIHGVFLISENITEASLNSGFFSSLYTQL